MTPALSATLDTHIVAQFRTGTAERRILRVRWDEEVTPRPERRFGSASGVPAQFACYGAEGHEKAWLKFTETMQWFVFRANCIRQYGKDYDTLPKLLQADAQFQFLRMFDSGRCFNNDWGVDDFHNYIDGTNATIKDPGWEQLVTSGNYVEWTGRTVVARTSYLSLPPGNYNHYEVRCININRLPTVEAFLSDPYTCHDCTTIQPSGGRGKFPQFGGVGVYPLWSTSDRMLIWEGFLI